MPTLCPISLYLIKSPICLMSLRSTFLLFLACSLYFLEHSFLGFSLMAFIAFCRLLDLLLVVVRLNNPSSSLNPKKDRSSSVLALIIYYPPVIEWCSDMADSLPKWSLGILILFDILYSLRYSLTSLLFGLLYLTESLGSSFSSNGFQ